MKVAVSHLSCLGIGGLLVKPSANQKGKKKKKNVWGDMAIYNCSSLVLIVTL